MTILDAGSQGQIFFFTLNLFAFDQEVYLYSFTFYIIPVLFCL